MDIFNLDITEILASLAIGATIAFHIGALISALAHEIAPAKWVWTVVIFMVPFFGAGAYWLIRLRKITSQKIE